MDNPWSWTQRLTLFSRKLRLDIPKDALVLEVGSGGSPHFRSDVLCEKYASGEGTARVGELKIDRPFVFGDAESLPFVDNAFDYVVCFHMLEHLDKPEKCLEELMRVARAGYIETPSEMTEKIQGWTCHKWFVRLEDGRLILTQKEEPVFDSVLHIAFHSLAHQRDRAYLKFIMKNRKLFTMAHEWKDTIEYEIFRAGKPVETSGFEEPVANDFSGFDAEMTGRNGNRPFEFDEFAKTLAYKLLRRKYARQDTNLLELLACPACKAKVVSEDDKLLCRECGRLYMVKDGIPILLEELAEPS